MNIDEVKKFCGSYEESDQKGIKIYDFEDVLPDCIDPLLNIDLKGNVLVIDYGFNKCEYPINKIKSIELYNMADEYDEEDEKNICEECGYGSDCVCPICEGCDGSCGECTCINKK